MEASLVPLHLRPPTCAKPYVFICHLRHPSSDQTVQQTNENMWSFVFLSFSWVGFFWPETDRTRYPPLLADYAIKESTWKFPCESWFGLSIIKQYFVSPYVFFCRKMFLRARREKPIWMPPWLIPGGFLHVFFFIHICSFFLDHDLFIYLFYFFSGCSSIWSLVYMV